MAIKAFNLKENSPVHKVVDGDGCVEYNGYRGEESG